MTEIEKKGFFYIPGKGNAGCNHKPAKSIVREIINDIFYKVLH